MADENNISPELNEKMTQLVHDITVKLQSSLPKDTSAQMSVLLVSYLTVGIANGLAIDGMREVINLTLDMVDANMESVMKNFGPTLLN